MYKELMRKKVELEGELKTIAYQVCELKSLVKSINVAIKEKEKELEDKQKEIYDIFDEMENEKLRIKQQKVEKHEAEMERNCKKIADLTNVLSSKSFYNSVRKYLPRPHWKKLTKAIQSDELFTFIIKHHYANRVIKAFKNDTELNKQIMEAIVNKLKTLIK